MLLRPIKWAANMRQYKAARKSAFGGRGRGEITQTLDFHTGDRDLCPMWDHYCVLFYLFCFIIKFLVKFGHQTAYLTTC